MKVSLLVLLVAFLAAAFSQEEVPADCSAILCPANTVCKAVTLPCTTDLCPQVACVAVPSIEDPCIAASCVQGSVCLPEPKQCFTTPCPQFKCLPMDEFVCATSVCAQNTRCVASPKQCFTTPCPQYDCVAIEEDDGEDGNEGEEGEQDQCTATSCTASQVCISEPKQCFTTPCPQFACLELSECPEVCAEDYAPVCGSNQITYPNICKLKAAMCLSKASIYVQYDGECTVEDECETICPMDYSPVCGSDMITYSNPCALKLAACKAKSQITQAHEGECTDEDCNIACTFEYAPVCGSDDQTYPNACSLRIAACKLKSGTLDVKYQGECEVSGESCPTFCPMNYSPVCGSDGVTYENSCRLQVAACNLKSTISVLHQGECTEEDSPCNGVCTEQYQPLCGSDFKTYANKCYFEAAKCLAKNLNFILHTGECKETLWESVATLDANDDDAVSFDEFAAAHPEMNFEQQSHAFKSFDLNKDGLLTSDDFEAGPDSSSSNPNRVAIIVGVLAAFIGGIALVIAATVYVRHQKKQQKQQEMAHNRNPSSLHFTKDYEVFEETL